MDVEELISQMTLEEKAAVMMGRNTWKNYGVKRLNIPELTLSDGPNGLRKQAGAGDHLGLNASVPATCFPTASAVANSWNVELGEEIGRALGEEAQREGVNVLLGPGLNIKRSPLCGRNFEYFSEDPVLAGKMAAAYIRGIQSQGVAACPKHFAVNSQEYKRMASDSVIDERTLRELYLRGFEIAVKEGHPKSIMSSYNMINGTYANENRHLLIDILRNEWGFDGFVVSDWGGSNNRTEGTRAGANLEMPAAGADSALGLIDDVKAGIIDESVLDDRLRELLPVIMEAAGKDNAVKKEYDFLVNHRIAKKAAAEGIVLLENDGILPLDGKKRIALIGEFAKKPRYQGAGSSMVNPTQVDNLVDFFENRYPDYAGYAGGYVRTGEKKTDNMTDEALALAKDADIVVFCMGLDEISESEGMDRRNMELPPEQVTLLRKVAAVNPDVVLVLSGGAPFVMPDRRLYRAVVHGYLSGQAGAGAMYDVLTGAVNPSGKLSESWPERLSDTPVPVFPCMDKHILYKESLYVGYRYYEKRNIKVRYPFGYGLSYTKFEYSDITYKDGEVSLDIANVGERDGSEVVQVYVGHAGEVFGPDKTLAAFDKVFLKAGEKKRVAVDIPQRAYEFYNTLSKKWEIEGGSYTILVGAASDDIRLKYELNLKGNMSKLPWKNLVSYMTGDISKVTDTEYEQLLGRTLPKVRTITKLEANDAICDLKYAKCAVARLAGRIIEKKKIASDSSTIPDLNILFVYNMPFRAIAKMTDGMISSKMVDDIMVIVNGHFFKGAGKLIADFVRNRRAVKKYNRKLEA